MPSTVNVWSAQEIIAALYRKRFRQTADISHQTAPRFSSTVYATETFRLETKGKLEQTHNGVTFSVITRSAFVSFRLQELRGKILARRKSSSSAIYYKCGVSNQLNKVSFNSITVFRFMKNEKLTAERRKKNCDAVRQITLRW